MKGIIEKIRNIQTPFFYPWAWAAILFAGLLIGFSIGIGFYLYCMITLNLS